MIPDGCRCLERISQQAEDGGLITEQTAVALQTAYTTFQQAYKQVADETQDRQIEVAEADEALARLEMYVRDIWEVVRRRVRREALPAPVYTYYGLTLAGDAPIVGGRDEWVQTAVDLIDGEKKAVATGYAPVPEPTIEQLQGVLDQARTSIADVDSAHGQVRESLSALVNARPALDSALADVVAEIQFNLRHEPAPAIRNEIRSYGGQYDYAPDEPREE